jgi:hypothetical protein
VTSLRNGYFATVTEAKLIVLYRQHRYRFRGITFVSVTLLALPRHYKNGLVTSLPLITVNNNSV